MAGLNNADAEAARVILSDIENKHFKHALTKVDKKLKKSDSDYFKALQLLIKAHIGQISEKPTILLQLEELLLSKRAVTDINAIDVYEETLGLILPKSGDNWARIIGSLRLQLVKALPKDVEAGRECFRACLAKEDYDHARHIANSLEKNFPNSHEFVFWNITTMFLYSQSHGYPEKERKLYGALADGMIRKLADATIKAANSSPLPTRSIHKVQEFRLMDVILRNGDPEKNNPVRLKYLEDPYLGPDSTIAKGEWQLWRLKLELLKKTPEALFQTTSELLKRARTKNKAGEITESRFSDWLVWESYIDTALLDKRKYQNEVEAELKAHLDSKSGIDKSWRRNASLASLKFALSPASAFSGDETTDKTDLIMDYLQRYGDTNVAFTDLRNVIHFLSTEDLDRLLPLLVKNDDQSSSNANAGEDRVGISLSQLNINVSKAVEITKLVNSQKLIYLITSSIPEAQIRNSGKNMSELNATNKQSSATLPGKSRGARLSILSWSIIQSYEFAINDDESIISTLLATDLHPADDLILLAATCLVKLSMDGSSNHASEPLSNPAIFHLLQAAVLLEYAWLRSKANSQISLMLTRIYHKLGCGTLARRAYNRLNVKNIQNATLTHYMFDGISTFHPHPFTTDDSSPSRSVIEDLRYQQNIYKSSPKQISTKIWSSFENNNYNTIFELEEVKKALAYNVSAVMSVLESRKVSRLTQPGNPLTASSNGYDILPLDIDNPNTQLADQNDHDTMPNYEVLGEFAPLIRLDREFHHNLPIGDRLQCDILSDKVRMVIDSIADPVSKDSARAWVVHNLSSAFEKTPEGNEFYAMAKIIEGVSSFDEILQMQLTDRLHEIENLGPESAPATREVLHSLYVAYDIATQVIKLNVHLSSTKSETKLNESLSLAERLLEAVITTSGMIKQSFDEGGWIDRVLSSVFQGDLDVDENSTSVPGALKSLVDENFMEAWAGMVVDSWKDSVKGFAYFKG